MRSRFGFPAIVFAAVTACGLLATPAHAAKSVRPGSTISSPLKNFEVSAPDFCLGTRLQKEGKNDRGMIAFMSDVGQLNRIDFFRLGDADAAVAAAEDSALTAGLSAHALAAMLAEADGTLLSQEPMRLDGLNALFAVAKFPKGSVIEHFQSKDGKLVRDRDDSIRGLLLFTRGGFLYRLHCEVGVDFADISGGMCQFPHKSGPNLPPDERDEAARIGIRALYSSITFL